MIFIFTIASDPTAKLEFRLTSNKYINSNNHQRVLTLLSHLRQEEIPPLLYDEYAQALVHTVSLPLKEKYRSCVLDILARFTGGVITITDAKIFRFVTRVRPRGNFKI